MFYELRVIAFCDNQQAFDDVLNKLDDLKDQMKVVNPDSDRQECSSIQLDINHHDQIPPAPCELISFWDNCPVAP